MLSPNEKKIEQILTNYFRNEMPEAIRQLPDGQSTQPNLQSVAIQQTTSRKRSLSVVAGLVAASCALLMVFFAVNIPVQQSHPSIPTGDFVKAKGDMGTIIPVDDSFKKKPVEMQGVNPQNWVKKIHIDPITGTKTETIEPKFDLNTKPHHKIQMVLPLDDDDEFEDNNSGSNEE